MKSNKNFQKSKKTNNFEGDSDTKMKKVDSSKKIKYFKKEIEDEIDESEEFDLFGFNDDDAEEPDDEK